MTHAVGWRNGDDAFLALGDDVSQMSVYRVVGAVRSPVSLHKSQLVFPGCLRFMPYAEPVMDLVEITDAQARKYRSLIVTRASIFGP